MRSWGMPTKLAPGEIKLEYWPILIGCIKGTPGSNEFGADPLRSLIVPTRICTHCRLAATVQVMCIQKM
jgi:hypothetical protein